MRAAKHTHISSRGNLSITSSDKKKLRKKEKKNQHNKHAFAKVESLAGLSRLAAPGPDADQQCRR